MFGRILSAEERKEFTEGRLKPPKRRPRTVVVTGRRGRAPGRRGVLLAGAGGARLDRAALERAIGRAFADFESRLEPLVQAAVEKVLARSRVKVGVQLVAGKKPGRKPTVVSAGRSS